MPVAFRNSPKQPDPAAPLDDLLAKGHFRAAAIVAVQELTGASGPAPTDSQRIFHLLYARLVCLTLIDATPLAAQEVKALEDLSDARTYIDDETGEHLVPWELRVLNVRLQALGFGDPRRAVMSYHDLAREARDHAARHDKPSTEVWRARLHELGVKVAGALIEMDDLAGAAHHLSTLRDRGDGKIALSQALLWLHLGDAESARKCTKNAPGTEKLILALSDMADGEYEAALAKWEDLRGDTGTDEMVGINMAVCEVYLGRISEVSTECARIPLTVRAAMFWKACSRPAARRIRCCLTCRPCTSCARSATGISRRNWRKRWPPWTNRRLAGKR